MRLFLRQRILILSIPKTGRNDFWQSKLVVEEEKEEEEEEEEGMSETFEWKN